MSKRISQSRRKCVFLVTGVGNNAGVGGGGGASSFISGRAVRVHDRRSVVGRATDSAPRTRISSVRFVREIQGASDAL